MKSFKLQKYAKHARAPLKYRFGKTGRWLHYDYTPSAAPKTFVLYGRLGKPLTALTYEEQKKGDERTITIHEIQRTHKRQLAMLLGLDKDYERELHKPVVKEARTQFDKAKQDLGINTSEFLFREFLFGLRGTILSGRTKIQLQIPIGLNEEQQLPYKTIIRKYFKPTSDNWTPNELDLAKAATLKLLFK